MTRQKKTTNCPFGGDGLGGKWKFWIMVHLLSGPKRFGELQRHFPEVSRQMLTIQLRELEQIGLLCRQVYPQVPPKVEYRLSKLGESLEPLLHQMTAWGRWYGEQIGPQDDWLMSLGGRWRFWIWYHLLTGPKRLSELQSFLPQASRQMLTIQLRALERIGVLGRQAPEQGSPKVAYTLSELGQQSESMLRQMYAWGRWCCEQMGLEYDWPIREERTSPFLQQQMKAASNALGEERAYSS